MKWLWNPIFLLVVEFISLPVSRCDGWRCKEGQNWCVSQPKRRVTDWSSLAFSCIREREIQLLLLWIFCAGCVRVRAVGFVCSSDGLGITIYKAGSLLLSLVLSMTSLNITNSLRHTTPPPNNIYNTQKMEYSIVCSSATNICINTFRVRWW
jgi:hypothetical protein